MEVFEMQEKLRAVLPPYRYFHTLGVSYLSAALAMCHGANVEKAEIAGLLHDAAKYMTSEEMLQRSLALGLPVNDAELAFPELLHPKLGAFFAKTEYGIEDEEILSAIASHTTGKPEMSLLQEIVFVADYIEPSRKGLPKLDEMREIAFKNLHCATALELSSTLAYLRREGAVIDPATIEAYVYYQKFLEE